MDKASVGDVIPGELFRILKDDTVKSVALNMPANLENSAVATGLEKVKGASKKPHIHTHRSRVPARNVL